MQTSQNILAAQEQKLAKLNNRKNRSENAGFAHIMISLLLEIISYFFIQTSISFALFLIIMGVLNYVASITNLIVSGITSDKINSLQKEIQHSFDEISQIKLEQNINQTSHVINQNYKTRQNTQSILNMAEKESEPER